MKGILATSNTYASGKKIIIKLLNSLLGKENKRLDLRQYEVLRKLHYVPVTFLCIMCCLLMHFHLKSVIIYHATRDLLNYG